MLELYFLQNFNKIIGFVANLLSEISCTHTHHRPKTKTVERKSSKPEEKRMEPIAQRLKNFV
jgi:hypothetical protein